MTPLQQAEAIMARRNRYLQVQQSLTAQQAGNISQLASRHPSLSPATLFGLGSANIPADSPAVEKVAQADQRVKRDQGNFFQRGLSMAYKGIKVAGGAVLPDEVGDTVKAVAPVLKGVTRGAEMGLSSIGQTMQGAGRGWAQDGELEFSDFASGFAQSDLAAGHRAIQQAGGYRGLLSGDVDPNKEGTQRRTDVDFGSGFFVGGAVESDAIQRRRAAAPLINGRAHTAGRWIAKEVGLEPGNLAYNIVSGLADLTVTLGTDPTSAAGPVTASLQARRLLAPQASRRFDAEAEAAQIDKRLAEAKVERFGWDRDTVMADIGALPGIRNTVDADGVLEWLTRKGQGQQVVRYLAEETDFGRAWDATKGKVDHQTLLALTSRKMTGDEVIEILGPKLGRTAQTEQKFGIDAVGLAGVGQGGLGTLATAKFKQKARDARWLGSVPERVLRKDDTASTLQTVSDFLRNTNIGADEVVQLSNGSKMDRSTIMRRFAEADGGAGMFEAATDLMEMAASKAINDFGVAPARARELFKLWQEASSDHRKYWIEQIVENGNRAWANKAFNSLADDEGFTKALPHLASQFLDNNVPLPDPRDIRNVMSKYSGILAGRGREKTAAPGPGGTGHGAYGNVIQVPQMAMHKIQEELFKPAVLLRPAFTLRNQIDEQFRPAGAGLNSLMNHPVQYLHWLMSDQDRVGSLLAKTGFRSRGATDATGEVFDSRRAAITQAREDWQNAKRSGDGAAIERAKDAYENVKKNWQSITPYTDHVSFFDRAVTGGVGNWRNRSFDQMKNDTVYRRADTDYSRAVGEGLHRIANDPLAQRIARGDDLDKIKQDFWRGPLQGHRVQLSKHDDRMAYLLDEIGAEQYVDDTVAFLRQFTGDSPELMRAAATGAIKGVPLTNGDTLQISKQALEQLDSLKSIEGFQGPLGVPGTIVSKGGMDDDGMASRAVNWMFYQLADRPTRYLARSPVFRQRYYKRMENLIGFMDEAAAEEVIAGARKANLKGGEIKRLQQRRTAGGGLKLEEADLVAKTDALEFTNDLFYTLHRRNQGLDALRLIFPFGEAFKDSAKKYSELAVQNPVLPYRLMQVIEGGRNADLNGDGEGFIYTDEQTQQEMFAFPGAREMLGMLGQEGAGQFRAPLQNLNILGTSVIPGFGPAVQINAAYMLPDEEDFNKVREFISPYGDRTIEGGAFESFLPAWVQKWRTAFGTRSPAQERAFMNSQKDWMGYLVSTGEYNLQDPADHQRLMDDAKGKARTTWFLRGLAQAFAPSPPSPEFVAYDKDGKLLTQFKLAEEYRKIMDEQKELGTPESANRVFIETFGEQAVLAVVPNTKAAQGESPIPPNRKALEFYQNNKGAADRFPTVFGLFAPDEEAAEFDFVAYNRQLSAGERVVITPEEAIRRANQNVARMIYTQAQNIVEQSAATGKNGKPKPSEEQRAALKALKEKLTEDFPGYSSSFANDIPGALADLKRASQDPDLGKTPAGEALAIWFKARDMSEQAAQQQYGAGWARSDKARHIRDSMRALADRLAADFEGFSNVYDRVLEREMADDREMVTSSGG